MFMAQEPTQQTGAGEKHGGLHESSATTDQLNLKALIQQTATQSHIYFQLLLVSESRDDLKPIFLPVFSSPVREAANNLMTFCHALSVNDMNNFQSLHKNLCKNLVITEQHTENL